MEQRAHVQIKNVPLGITRYRLTYNDGLPARGYVILKREFHATTGDDLWLSTHPQRHFVITKIDGQKFHITENDD